MQITAFLEISGLVWFRQNMGGILRSRNGETFYTPNPLKGFPDLAGYFPDGRGWAMEVKTAKGVIAPEQKDWLARLSSTNVKAAVVRSLDEAVSFLSQLE